MIRLKKGYLILLCFSLLCCLLHQPELVNATEIVEIEEEPTGVPRLIVSGYNIKSGNIVPGETFDLELMLKNTGYNTTVYSVLVTISMTSTGMYPSVGSSNQMYIEKIDAQQEENFVFPLEVAEKMTDINTRITVSIDFIDNVFGALNNTVYIVLPISYECLLDAKIALAKSSMQNSNSLVNVKLVNEGLEEIYNIVLHLDGAINVEQKENSFGLLDTGGQLITDYYVTFMESGVQDLMSYFTYEDREGNTYTSEVVKDSVYVEAYSNLESNNSYDTSNVMEKDSMSTLEIALLGVIGFIIIVGVILLIRKSIKWRSKP